MYVTVSNFYLKEAKFVYDVVKIQFLIACSCKLTEFYNCFNPKICYYFIIYRAPFRGQTSVLRSTSRRLGRLRTVKSGTESYTTFMFIYYTEKMVLYVYMYE